MNDTASRRSTLTSLSFIGPVKALALIGIIWNHLVEEFWRGPWMTNPSAGWSDLGTRLRDIFPTENGVLIGLVQFVGWLGDSCPGVFILLSGMTLTLSALQKSQSLNVRDFYRRRISRIFPLLIAVHFLFFALALFVPGSEIAVDQRRSLLSMLGLRFTEGMFFFLNPSWWFVWLILQLYLVFPALYWLLNRVSLRSFLLITCGATFACRAIALAGFHPGSNVYFTMTGLFFGTRLAEFTIGMAAAKVAVHLQAANIRVPQSIVVKASVATYVVGFGCSLFWYTSIVSNLLVSVGLTGLFYLAWSRCRREKIRRVLSWIGAESFAVFLIHQPLFMWTRPLLGESTSLRLIAVLALLLLSFPLAWFVRVFVDRALQRLHQLRASIGQEISEVDSTVVESTVQVESTIQTDGSSQGAVIASAEDSSSRAGRIGSLLFGFAPALAGWTYLIVLSPVLADRPRLDSLIVATFMLFAAAMQWCLEGRRQSSRLFSIADFLNVGFVTAAFLSLWVLPEGSALSSVMIGSVFGAVFVGLRGLNERFGSSTHWFRTAMFAGAASLVLVAVTEVALWRIAPLETAAWGELPALQVHETRAYSLKPNLDIRLRYNNYDYRLRTNSLGLVGPEIDESRQPGQLRILILGDAFSMPEGVEYEAAYPALLERQLQTLNIAPSVQVISGGVTGYGPRETLAQLKELGPRLKPDIVVYQFFINEFGEVALSPKFRRQAIGLERSRSIDEHLLMNSQVFNWSQCIGACLQETVLRRSHEWRHQKALLHYLKAGPSPFYSADRVALVERFLVEIQSEAKQLGAGFNLMYVPPAAVVTAKEDMAYFPNEIDLTNPLEFDINRARRVVYDLTERLQIPLLDLTEPLRRHARQPVYFPESWHWNTEGHRVAAQELTGFLLRD